MANVDETKMPKIHTFEAIIVFDSPKVGISLIQQKDDVIQNIKKGKVKTSQERTLKVFMVR